MPNVFVFKPSTEPQGTTFIFGEPPTSIEASIEMCHGASLEFSLIVPIVSEMYSGSVLDTIVTFYEQYNISAFVYHGENVAYQLARFVRFIPDMLHGEYVYTDIKYSAVLSEPYDAFGGEYVDTNVSHTISLPHLTNDGSYFEANILFPENYSITSVIYDGEYVVTDNLSLTASIQPVIYVGSEVLVTLTTYQSFSVDVYSGQTYDGILTVATPVILDIDIVNGAYTDCELSLQVVYNVDVTHGGVCLFEVETNPQQQITFDSYSGSYLYTVIDTTTLLACNVFSGSECTVTVEDATPLEIVTNIETGQYYNAVDLYYDFSVGTFNTSGGEYAVVTALDEVPNNNQYSGEYVEVSLSTSVNADVSAFGGEYLDTVLSYYESTPVGTFTAYNGAHLQTNLNTLRSVTFTSYMSHDISLQIDRWQSLDIMLGTKCCHTPNKHSQLIVDLSSEPDTDLYIGNAIQGVLFESSLSIVRLLDFSVTHGSSFIVSAGATDEYTMHSGSSLYATMYTEPVIHLNSGGLSYSGDIVYEIVRTITETITAHTVTSGELLYTNNISLHYQYTTNTYSGDYVTTELTVYEAIRFNMYDGQYVEANPQTTASLQFDVSHGCEVECQLYEEPYIITAGEYAIITALETDYEVEFLEIGLLENNYIRVDQDGVPIDIDTTEMSIEGELYNRFIKGRCY